MAYGGLSYGRGRRVLFGAVAAALALFIPTAMFAPLHGVKYWSVYPMGIYKLRYKAIEEAELLEVAIITLPISNP